MADLSSFAGVAAACGYAAALETEDVGQIAAWLQAPPNMGPRFAPLLTRTGTAADLPCRGAGGLSGKLFRIAIMGAVTAADIERLLKHIARIAR